VFKFTLPKDAAIVVASPTGGNMLFVHKGDGEFVSDLPPLVLMGVSTSVEQHVEDLPVVWDGTSFPVGGTQHKCTFVFDTVGASKSVEAAAAAGDPAAVDMINRLADADKVLKARESIGMVKAPEVVQ